jgi:hypothetical protein
VQPEWIGRRRSAGRHDRGLARRWCHLRGLRKLVPERWGYFGCGRLVGRCYGAWQNGRRALRNRGLGGRDRIAAVRQDPTGLEGSEDQYARDDAIQEATARFGGGRLGGGFIRHASRVALPFVM